MDNIFAFQNAPTEEEREKEFEKFLECMEAATGGKGYGDIWLGQSQPEMISAMQEVLGPFNKWSNDIDDCIQRHYDALWPETIIQ